MELRPSVRPQSLRGLEVARARVGEAFRPRGRRQSTPSGRTETAACFQEYLRTPRHRMVIPPFAGRARRRDKRSVRSCGPADGAAIHGGHSSTKRQRRQEELLALASRTPGVPLRVPLAGSRSLSPRGDERSDVRVFRLDAGRPSRRFHLSDPEYGEAWLPADQAPVPFDAAAAAAVAGSAPVSGPAGAAAGAAALPDVGLRGSSRAFWESLQSHSDLDARRIHPSVVKLIEDERSSDCQRRLRFNPFRSSIWDRALRGCGTSRQSD